MMLQWDLSGGDTVVANASRVIGLYFQKKKSLTQK